MRQDNMQLGQHDKRLEEYEKPAIVDYGELSELTAGTATGVDTDAAFPARTPISHLTFS